MLLVIDNYDSFTYNLVQYLGELGADVHVHRNDAITLGEIRAWEPEAIVISPGPCTPSEAGISVPLVGVFAGVPSPLTVTRYHSLAIERASLPPALVVTATSDDGEIMGVRHREHAI